MGKQTDTICIDFEPNKVGNIHTIQAFCEVINEQDNTCRCPLYIKVGKHNKKIGEIFKVLKFDGTKPDCSDCFIKAYVRLNDNFVNNFCVASKKRPEILIEGKSGLISRIVLLNWHEQFTSRNPV